VTVNRVDKLQFLSFYFLQQVLQKKEKQWCTV